MSVMRKGKSQLVPRQMYPNIGGSCKTSLINFFSIDKVDCNDSTKVAFYMDSSLVFISTSCNISILQNLLSCFDRSLVAVLHTGGKAVGIVTKNLINWDQGGLIGRTAGDLATPWEQVATINASESVEAAVNHFTRDNSFLVVLHRNRPVGVLRREDIAGFADTKRRKIKTPIKDTSFLKIANYFPEGLVVLDKNQTIVYHNKQLLELFPEIQCRLRGKKFELVFGSVFAKNHKEFKARCPINRVIENRLSVNDMEGETVTGHIYRANYYPIIHRENFRYVVITFRDITHRKTLETEAHIAYEELTKAFRLMLPSTKIEKVLKSIPEYKDYFDHSTGLVEIAEIIPDGAYRHAINCLKIASELHEKGVFKLPGIERNTIVQVLITHDIGKKQPQLKIGDVVDPRVCFGEGKVHAGESAKIISKFPYISPEVIKLVQYHHHGEDELPDDYPARLLPMLRLIKLVDGLSAGVTRKNAKLNFVLDGSRIIVFEKNSNAGYNGVREVDLITGETGFYNF